MRISTIPIIAALWLLALMCTCCQQPLTIVESSKADISPSSKDIYDGGSISIEISSNAKTLKIVSIKCDYPLSNPSLGTLTSGAILDMESVNQSALFSSSRIHIPFNKEETLSLVLEDMDLRERHSFEITFAFWNTPAIIPEDITVGLRNVTVSCDETWNIPIIMGPPGAMGGFDYKVIKEEDAPYLQVRKDEDSGYLFITGGERGGKAVIRVFSTLRPSVYTDIDVYVRHRVALIIDASFSRWYSNILNESLKFRSGACDALSATLAWWSGDLDSQGDRVDLDNIKFTQCNAHEAFTPYFYYECDKYGISSEDIRNGKSPTKTDEGGFLAGAPLCYASKVNDLPMLYMGDGKNAPESQKYYNGDQINPSCIDWYSDLSYKGKDGKVYSSF